MNITNELKAIEEVNGAIKRGYGFEQLKSKLDLTEAEILKLGAKHPDFLNELNKRYKLNLVAEKPSEIKEVKEDKAESIREQAKRLGIKNWHNKSEAKLLEEITLLNAE